MTVAELREWLEAFPDDAVVVQECNDADGSWGECWLEPIDSLESLGSTEIGDKRFEQTIQAVAVRVA